MDFVTFAGYAIVLFTSYHFLCIVWKIFRGYILTKFGFVKNLSEYGKWAVVTGSTDGIGKEYAKQLAKHGFNIVLMSRTLSKLETVANEIREQSDVEVKVIQCDFAKITSYSEIEKELSSLDIGILVNNVGMSDGSLLPHHQSDMQPVRDIITCNIFPDVQLTNIALKGMIQRKRGAIIHISSGSILIAAPCMSIYPATKCFIDKFATSMKWENDGVVDHQLVIPMWVATKMSKMKPMIAIPTAQEYVTQAIRTIGLLDRTCGYWSHEFQYLLMLIIPNFVILKAYIKIRESRLKRN